MRKLLYNCRSLTSLSDISKWNTSNVIDMNKMFYNCFSLSSLPDLSKWNVNNANNMIKCFIVVYHYHQYLPNLNGMII